MRGIGRIAALLGAGLSLLAVVCIATALPAPQSGRRPRFQAEIYGGLAQPGLSDLNSLARYDKGIQEFFYDSLYESQRRAGTILNWNKSETGERALIGLAFPLGFRARLNLCGPFAVSLGVKLSYARRESDYSFDYTRRDPDQYENRETVAYRPYLLSAKSLAVLAGVHFAKPLYKKMSLEAFLAAGPVFADCNYSSSWEYTWHRTGHGENWDVTQLTGLLEEKGRGTGLAADLGARVQYPFGQRLALFLEGAYTYQVVKTIKGKGREIRGDEVTEWEGTWAFKKETIQAPWGTMEAETPTNYWLEGSASSRSRDFRLNASGFTARIGLSFLF